MDEEARKRKEPPVIPSGSDVAKNGGNTLPGVQMGEANVKTYSDKVISAMASVKIAVNGVKEPIQELEDAWKKGNGTFSETFKAVAAEIEKSGTLIQKVTMAAAVAAESYAEKGGSSFRELGKAALAGGAKWCVS